MMNDNFFTVLAGGFPADRSKTFTFEGARVTTYAQLDDGAARLTALLTAKGVRPGDRVAVKAPKTVSGVILYLAVLKLGGIYLPLNPSYTASETDYIVKDAEPALVVTDPDALTATAAELQPAGAAVDRNAGDAAAIIYTSGTTGRPKGAVLSHGALASNARSLHAAWGFQQDDVLVHALPLFHIHGLFISLSPTLLNGSSIVWLEKFDEAAVLEGLSQATILMGVPTFYTRLLKHPGLTAGLAARVRLFISGSAPLRTATFEEFESRTGKRILERYGMSESGIISTNPLNGERVAGSVGYALPGTEIRLDETEEIQVRGPGLLSEYWGMPEKTREAFTEDGFFKTGDLGMMDPDGRLWINGRSKDLIITGGYNVYPKEVEQVLDEIGGIVESAVFGLPHPDFGEAVAAAVVGSGSEASIIAAALAKLAPYKAPKRVFFLEQLPRNTMGKVQKAELRKSLGNAFL